MVVTATGYHVNEHLAVLSSHVYHVVDDLSQISRRRRQLQQVLHTITQTANTHIYKQECTHREQTSADPDDPDFGLWTPGSEA